MAVDEHVPPEVKEQPLNSEQTKEKTESTRECRGCSGRTNKVNSLWLDRQQKERETKEECPGRGNRSLQTSQDAQGITCTCSALGACFLLL